MKNHIVKAKVQFDDYEGLEIKPENPRTRRNVNDVFHCTKERYEYLKGRGLVDLVGIDKITTTEEAPAEKKAVKTETAPVTKKTTTARKTKKK